MRVIFCMLPWHERRNDCRCHLSCTACSNSMVRSSIVLCRQVLYAKKEHHWLAAFVARHLNHSQLLFCVAEKSLWLVACRVPMCCCTYLYLHILYSYLKFYWLRILTTNWLIIYFHWIAFGFLKIGLTVNFSICLLVSKFIISKAMV